MRIDEAKSIETPLYGHCYTVNPGILHFTEVNFSIGNFNFNHLSLLDPGASISTFPLQRLPPEFKAKLTSTTATLQGIGGNAKVVGEINCDVKISGETSAPFRNVTFVINDANIPILIGNDILDATTVHSFTIAKPEGGNNCTRDIIIQRRLDGKTVAEKTKTFTKQQVREHFNTNVADDGAILVSSGAVDKEGSQDSKNIKNHESSSNTVTKPPIPSTPLKVKKDWLQTNFGIKLGNQCTDYETNSICDLLIEYSDVIGSPDGELGTYVESVRLPTDGTSKAVPQFKISPHLQKEFDTEVQRMINEGILVECTDPKGFNSPMFPVRKKNGKVRVVVNYAPTLNLTLKDHDPWPIAGCDEIIAKIGKGNKYFGVIDLRSGYWQVPLHPEDQYKTAVTYNNKCLMYTRLAMGITTSAQIFSRCIAKTTNQMPSKEHIATFLDDNLCYAKHFSSYRNTLKDFLQCLRQNGLKYNGEKSHFLQKSAVFLGRHITAEGFGVVDEYVTALKNLPSPTTKKETQSLVGRLVWLRQMLDSRIGEKIRTNAFSGVIKPIINTVTVKAKDFIWTEQAEVALSKIRKRLSSTPIIHFADFSKPFALITDASEIAAGAVLMQDFDGNKSIVAAVSRTFSKTEQKWSASEREAFAIKWSILKFDHFLRYRMFHIFSDHRALCYLDKREFANPKISRWQEALKPYKFVVEYIRGCDNKLADMLSRPAGLVKSKTVVDDRVAGEYFDNNATGISIYVPSWLKDDISTDKITFTRTKGDIKAYVNTSNACFTGRTNPVNSIQAVQNCYLASEQEKDDILLKIIIALDAGDDLNEALHDCKDERVRIYKNHLGRFQLEHGTGLLTINDNNDNKRFVVPIQLRSSFLVKAHNDCNHGGQTRTSENLRKYWWEGIDCDVIDYINSCTFCAKRKGRYGQKTTWIGGHCLRGSRPFQVVFLDFVSLPNSHGKQFALTMICSFTKFMLVFPSAKARAIDAVNGLVQLFYRHRVVPEIISSDRGTHFKNELVGSLCKELNIKQNIHTAYHPESCGVLERAHRTLKNALFILCEERHCGWTQVLEATVSNMNACINRATKYSPYELVTGRKPEFGFPGEANSIETHSSGVVYAQKVKSKINEIYRAVKIANEEADFKMDAKLRQYLSKNPILPNDEVLIFRPQSVMAKRTHMDWIGPYRVLKTNNMVIQVIKDGLKDWVHMAHVRKIMVRPEHLEGEEDVLQPLIPTFPATKNTENPISVPNIVNTNPDRQPTLDNFPDISTGEPIVEVEKVSEITCTNTPTHKNTHTRTNTPTHANTPTHTKKKPNQVEAQNLTEIQNHAGTKRSTKNTVSNTKKSTVSKEGVKTRAQIALEKHLSRQNKTRSGRVSKKSTRLIENMDSSKKTYFAESQEDFQEEIEDFLFILPPPRRRILQNKNHLSRSSSNTTFSSQIDEISEEVEYNDEDIKVEDEDVKIELENEDKEVMVKNDGDQVEIETNDEFIDDSFLSTMVNFAEEKLEEVLKTEPEDNVNEDKNVATSVPVIKTENRIKTYSYVPPNQLVFPKWFNKLGNTTVLIEEDLKRLVKTMGETRFVSFGKMSKQEFDIVFNMLDVKGYTYEGYSTNKQEICDQLENHIKKRLVGYCQCDDSTWPIFSYTVTKMDYKTIIDSLKQYKIKDESGNKTYDIRRLNYFGLLAFIINYNFNVEKGCLKSRSDIIQFLTNEGKKTNNNNILRTTKNIYIII